MANKMLIDASHPEETRVVVLRGNRVEEFDFESASKKQLRGNIYLAKVTRVEPSLQAAFVDYGGNRHGFLAFSEIHPDYYQIPVSDRQALIDEDARTQGEDDEDDSRAPRRSRRFRRGDRNGRRSEKRRADDETVSDVLNLDASGDAHADDEPAEGENNADEAREQIESNAAETQSREPDEATAEESPESAPASFSVSGEHEASSPAPNEENASPTDSSDLTEDPDHRLDEPSAEDERRAPADPVPDDSGERISSRRADSSDEGEEEDEHIEQLGGDALEEVPSRPQRYRKQYKIQEVIKRRQVLLVQVVKEERGNKGAALTTYLSLAGRYSVLMPNTARGGGISRKITDSEDRQRLKSIAQELEVPEGMGVILRTAGASRTKAEVKRDFEYLMRMWEIVRETTLQSTAPTLVYEEGSLIKRSIRDLFNKDIDEIVVAGETGYREAKEFMRLLMPSHVKNVRPYRDPQPIFAKHGAEAQLDAMFSNQVTLKSGGYIVINQTEALVAIDVNSGRSTREHNIEDTALRTNLEAADEVTRQLRLRDLAGLIVIDFIDMEESRNNRAVERRLKEALKNDRARIQVGRISHFGLLEMSRQRIRTGVLEGSTVICPHCAGAGTLRSTSSVALHILRILEDALIKSASHDIIVKTTETVALYILNQKRAHLSDLERRFGVAATITVDDTLTGAVHYALERGEPATGIVAPPFLLQQGALPESFDDLDDEAEEGDALPPESAAAEETFERVADGAESDSSGETDAEGRRKRRRRRRRGRGGDREGSGIAANAPQPPDDALDALTQWNGLEAPPPAEADAEPQAAESDAPAEAVVVEPVEAVIAVEEAEAPVEETSPRRRSRRGGRGAREAAAASVEAAPELNLALEATAETAASAESAGTAEAPAEAAPAAAPKARRAPRARAPRRTAAPPEPAEASVSTSEAVGAVQEPSPAIAETPQSETPQPEAAPVNAGVDADGAAAQPAPEVARPSSEREEPARPKRSGWWQRAKASLKG